MQNWWDVKWLGESFSVFFLSFLHFNEHMSCVIDIVDDSVFLGLWIIIRERCREWLCCGGNSGFLYLPATSTSPVKDVLSLSCKLKSAILTSILAACEPKTVLYTGNSLPEPKTFV